MSKSFAVIVPTLNPGKWWESWVSRLSEQSLQPNLTLVVDSESNDGAVQRWSAYNQQTLHVKRSAFNHGGTRQWAVEQIADKVDVVVFLTQDALLANQDSLECLLKVFDIPEIVIAYGRQLPHVNSGPLATHARLFNYGGEALVKSAADINVLGIKTCFTSNSFAAYRVKDLIESGGFPQHVILSEDTYVAARTILNGGAIAYVPQACVFHSHDYTLAEEFARYFDIGVFHACEPWIMQRFGQAEGEGGRFVRSESQYLMAYAPQLLPNALLRSFLKWCGYRAGKIHAYLPRWLCKKMSMHKRYWDRSANEATCV